MKSQADIITFYGLYYPTYSEVLIKSIAQRISGIIEKSRRGETLTEAERGYVERSKPRPNDDFWDPALELAEEEMQGKIHLTMQRMEGLCDEEEKKQQ